MKNHFTFFGWLVAFLLCNHSVEATKWDQEYWQYFNGKQWKHGAFELFATAEIRFRDNFSNCYHYRITENAAYQVSPCLTFELHYSFLLSKSFEPEARFNKRHRFELIADSLFKLNSHLEMGWRTRFDFEKREHEPGIESIFRPRLTIIFPIKNKGILTSIKCSDEMFFHIRTNEFTQNRLRLPELDFALTPKVSLAVFFIFRQFISANQWRKSFIFGTDLGF